MKILSIKKNCLFFLLIISFLGLFFISPMPQRLSYHEFADSRVFFNIPNFMDVMSNCFFLIFGLIGAIHCFKVSEKLSWKIFFVAMTLIAFGSAYYHYFPNNQTLYWDRLPMTIAFMSFFSALVGEFVDQKLEWYFLLIFIPAGILAVTYWRLVDDMRFYVWIQMVPMVSVILLMVFFKSSYTHSSYLILVFFAYYLAKVSESFDKEIFTYSFQIMSGHTLKHLLAGIASLIIFLMLRKRQILIVAHGR